jgi:hypothetical protein
MSSNKKVRDAELPNNMATPVVKLQDLGLLVAQQHNLPAGHYELVIEYKFGAGRLQNEDGSAMGAMALTFGGLGLRPAVKPSPMTIEVMGDGAGRSSAKKPAKTVRARRA